MIHRIHPNMQLALFDSLDHLYASGDDYWDEHLRKLKRHTIISPAPGALGVGAGAPPRADRGRPAALLPRAKRRLPIHPQGRPARRGDPAASPPGSKSRSSGPSSPGSASATSATSSSSRARSRVPDGTIYLTYGAADRCVGAASVVTAEVVAALRNAA